MLSMVIDTFLSESYDVILDIFQAELKCELDEKYYTNIDELVELLKSIGLSESLLDYIEDLPDVPEKGMNMIGQLEQIDLMTKSLKAYIQKQSKNGSAQNETDLREVLQTVSNQQNILESIQNKLDMGTIESTSEKKALKLAYTQTISGILACIMTFIQLILALKTEPIIPEMETKPIQYVTNYYFENGYSKDYLNTNGIRIANRNIKPRELPDNSSRVIGQLPAGKVVSIIDKKHKWYRISWTDSEGEFFSGWIQNYTLSEFK